MANLICRLPEPLDCLSRVIGPDSIIKKGGYLVITSPFSWLEQYTAKNRWLGTVDKNGNYTDSFTNLKKYFDGHFELLREEPFPFLIREHSRKFQFVMPQLSVWKKL